MISDEFAIAPVARRYRSDRKWIEFAPSLCVLAAAVLLRLLTDLNSDTSWFLTAAEKMLHGARPYVDFLEINPPASLLLYIPPVALAHLLGIADEAALTGLVFAGAFASIGLSARIASPLIAPRERPMFLGVALLVLLVLPDYAFAQREHVAVMAALPMLCVYTMRSKGFPVSFWLCLLAGLGGGIAVSIKPYFAMAFVLPLTAILLRARKTGQILPILFSLENIVWAAVVLCYGGIVICAFPAFLSNMLPAVSAIYSPVPRDMLKVMINLSVLLWAAGIALFLVVSRMKSTDAETLILASAGFVLCVAVQGKGWPYHGYPAIALATMVLGFSLIREWAGKTWPFKLLHLVLATVFAFGCFWWFDGHRDLRELAQTVERIAPPHPKLITISQDISLGHPLVRQIGGEWAGSVASNWMSEYVRRISVDPDYSARKKAEVQKYAQIDRRLLMHDIVTNHPDVILIDGARLLAWAMANKDTAAAMSGYRKAATVEDVEVFLRKNKS